jgi:hypothetical protein
MQNQNHELQYSILWLLEVFSLTLSSFETMSVRLFHGIRRPQAKYWRRIDPGEPESPQTYSWVAYKHADSQTTWFATLAAREFTIHHEHTASQKHVQYDQKHCHAGQTRLQREFEHESEPTLSGLGDSRIRSETFDRAGSFGEWVCSSRLLIHSGGGTTVISF